MNTNQKFYQKNWFIYLCMLFFPPAGIILMWIFNKKSSVKFKGILTVIATAWFIFVINSNPSTPDNTEQTVSNENSVVAESTISNEDSLIAESTIIESEISVESTNDTQTEQESMTTSESDSEIQTENTLQISDQESGTSTELFEQIYVPYANREKSFVFYGVKNYVSTLEYEIEITEPSEEHIGEIKIIDTNGDYVYLTFYPVNDIETITLVNYHRAETNSEVSMENYSADNSPQFDSFTTHIIGEGSVEVTGTDEQREFLFNTTRSSLPENSNVIQPESESESASTATADNNDIEVPEPSTELASINNNTSSANNNFNTYDNVEQQQTTASYVLNTNTKKIHHPYCSSVSKIAPKNYATSSQTVEELISQGYSTCKRCF